MKKSQLTELIRKIINEELELESRASDDAKRQGLVNMGFGRWGKDGKVTHTTQSGKLVPFKSMNPTDARKAKEARPRVTNTPAVQRAKNRPQPEFDAKYDAMGGRSDSAAGNRIISKVNSKFFDTQKNVLSKYDYDQDIPSDEFVSLSGIPKIAAMWVAKNNDDWEQPFTYDAETDTFSMTDLMSL